jgi:putative addiction module component (TIGR02574 family)
MSYGLHSPRKLRMSTDLETRSPLLVQLGIYDMPNYQRLALAQQIIASVIAEETPTPPAPLTDAQLQELRRRVAHAEAHPEELIPSEVVIQEVRARLAAMKS